MVDDKTILKLISNPTSSREGYRILITQNKEKLYWHIRKMVSDHDDADDILQNVFLKVIKHIKDFKGESSLFTWMFKIARNESLNHVKQAKIRSTLEIKENFVSHLTTHNENFEEEASYHSLLRAMETLPLKQKEVFIMRYFDELPYKDMANMTGTSEGALKASYHLAVQKITHFLTNANLNQ
ncbi:MAG: RNA polymerase sigma factor [Saprospiraceae bacterium]